MKIAKFRRLCRMVFFVGATIMFFGVGVYALDQQIVGILLLITGLVVAIISFSFTYIFMIYDMTHDQPQKEKRTMVKTARNAPNKVP